LVTVFALAPAEKPPIAAFVGGDVRQDSDRLFFFSLIKKQQCRRARPGGMFLWLATAASAAIRYGVAPA
jgi:hypothetical protein